jgi:hypothetical protein
MYVALRLAAPPPDRRLTSAGSTLGRGLSDNCALVVAAGWPAEDDGASLDEPVEELGMFVPG